LPIILLTSRLKQVNVVHINSMSVNTLPRHVSCYKQCLHTSRTNIHSSYAVIWTQVTTISDVGFHVMQTNKHLQFIYVSGGYATIALCSMRAFTKTYRFAGLFTPF